MAQEETDEPITLRSTSVGRPQLEHTTSKQSITASEDYQSAHSEPSDTSRPSTADNAEVSPTLQTYSSTAQSRQPRGFNSFLPPTQEAYSRLQQHAQVQPRDSGRIRRKPVGSAPSSSSVSSENSNGKISETVPSGSTRMNREISPSITPGLDDSPYIRFALDQLTRDEDIRGSRRYANNERWSANPTGIVTPYGLPSLGSKATTGGSPQLHQHSNPPLPIPQPGQQSTSQPAARYAIFPAAAAGNAGATPTLTAMGPSYSHTSIEADEGYVTPEEEPRNLRQQRVQPAIRTGSFSQHHQRSSTLSNPNDVFVPFDQGVPPLRFLPGILRPLWLGLYIFLCTLVLVGLGFSGGYSRTHLGLFAYTNFGGSRYFVFEYLPLMICMFLLLWLFQIQIAVQRIAPFILMASHNSKSRSEAPLLEMQPTNFLLPKIFYFRAGQPIIGFAMVVFWLQIFAPPLFAALYNVYYFGAPDTGNWKWVAVQGVVWTLFALYLLLIIALITLGIWLWRQRTGLRWDPRSLADIMALLFRSNISDDYNNSETFASPADFNQLLALRSDRLGYWTTSTKPNDAFYGVGEEGGPTRLYSLHGGQLREKPSPAGERSRFSPDTPTTAGVIPFEEDDEYERLRYRHLPWYLSTSAALIWVVGGIALFLAFIIVSFVNNAVIHGFSPLLPVAPNADGFSSTNFLYSFIPALIAQLIFLSWLSIDYSFRRLQPYAAMTSAVAKDTTGGSAEHTLLLDYTSRLPISITVAAIRNGNFRVAWFSFLSLLAACFPILAGGCFWAQFYVQSQMVRVAVNPGGYYTLCVFLALFAFSLPLILFGMHKRRLPHACTTLAEQISWLYASNLLGEREWRGAPVSKAEMASRLITAITSAEREFFGGRFQFGRFMGRDGRIHIGIDRIGRESGRTTMSQRTWRHDDDGLTSSPREKPTTYSGDHDVGSNTAQHQNGHFVPTTASGSVTTPAPIYDDSTGRIYHPQQGPVIPAKAATAPPARPVRTNSSPYHQRTGSSAPLLNQPAIAGQRHPSASSSIYPSGVPSEAHHSRFISDTPTYVADHTSSEPSKEPLHTAPAPEYAPISPYTSRPTAPLP